MSDEIIDRLLRLSVKEPKFRGCNACSLKGTPVRMTPSEEETLLKASKILKEKSPTLSENLKDFVQRRGQ